MKPAQSPLTFKLFTFLAILLLPTVGVMAGEPPTEPILRLETGMHTGAIGSIGVDRNGRWLLTSSDDKTLRLWSLADGQLLNTLRIPIGLGKEGMLYCGAISPDGRLLAVSGWTGKWENGDVIYIFDRASGALVHRLPGLPNVLTHLAFSQDGKMLAASLAGDDGILVWSSESWKLLARDQNYNDASYWCDFDHNGRLVTTSYDGFIRLYDQDIKLIAKKKPAGGKQPFSAVFSPDSQRIAVGFAHIAAVVVLSGQDLSQLYRADTSNLNKGDLTHVTWSIDGSRLFGGGHYSSHGNSTVVVWEQAGQGRRSFWPTANDTIMDLRTLPDNSLLVATADPTWQRFSSSGQVLMGQRSVIPDLRTNVRKNFRLSRDGSQVAFVLDSGGKNSVFYDLSLRRLQEGSTDKKLYSSVLTVPGLKITDWKNTYKPMLNNQLLNLKQYEFSRSLAINPDNQSLLLGTSWRLRCYDRKGKLRWQKPVPDDAWGVNISQDGRLAVAALGDGTIRWYRYDDGQELLALFVHKKTREWVVWSPSGYYDASPGGDRLIGFHVNNGKDRAADFFPVGTFRKQFYRPMVIGNMLAAMGEKRAVTLANKQGERTNSKQSIAQSLPPVVEIVSPGDGEEFSSAMVTLRYTIKNPTEKPVSRIQVLVDGIPLETERSIKRVKKSGSTFSRAITLPKRNLQLGLIAENSNGSSPPATVNLVWKGQSNDFIIQPKLYVLAAGVSDYEDNSLDLTFPAKDARDFGRVLQNQKRLYREVIVKVLENPASDALLDGLDWLRREVTAKDVAILFLAGHGVNDPDGDYYFLTSDSNPERLRRTAIAYFDIKKTLTNLPGKRLAFIDTCHSGSVMGARRGIADINGMINDLTAAENGVVVFASSSGRQYSLEDKSWGNGAFTKALVEGLSGRADYNHDGRITINQLDFYLSERVKQLTGNRQTPTTTKPQTIADFPIAVNGE